MLHLVTCPNTSRLGGHQRLCAGRLAPRSCAGQASPGHRLCRLPTRQGRLLSPTPYLDALRGQLRLLHALHCQIVPLACCFRLLLHILRLRPPLLQNVLPPGRGLPVLAASLRLRPVLRLPTAANPCLLLLLLLLLLWLQLPALVIWRRLHCMRHLTGRNSPRCQANAQPRKVPRSSLKTTKALFVDLTTQPGTQ